MKVTFEYIPEHYTGEFPYAVIRIKQSQLTPNLQSSLEEQFDKIRTGLFTCINCKHFMLRDNDTIYGYCMRWQQSPVAHRRDNKACNEYLCIEV